MNCPVIVTDNSELSGGSAGVDPTGPVPRVCPCECKTCRQAWWDAGRPFVRDGKVIAVGIRIVRDS